MSFHHHITAQHQAGRITNDALAETTQVRFAAYISGDYDSYRQYNETTLGAAAYDMSMSFASDAILLGSGEAEVSPWDALPDGYDPDKVVAVAAYRFVGQEPGELSFPRDALLSHVTPMEDSAWLQGEYKGEIGMFPTSFVNLTTTEAILAKQAEASAASGDAEREDSGVSAVALYNFDASHMDELSFVAGQHISNVWVCEGEDEWLSGAIDGRIGMFPSSFVRILDDAAPAAPEPAATEPAAADTLPQVLPEVLPEPAAEALPELLPEVLPEVLPDSDLSALPDSLPEDVE